MYYIICFPNVSGMWYYDSINHGGRYVRRHHDLAKLEQAKGPYLTIHSYISYIAQINNALSIDPDTAIITPLNPITHPELFI